MLILKKGSFKIYSIYCLKFMDNIHVGRSKVLTYVVYVKRTSVTECHKRSCISYYDGSPGDIFNSKIRVWNAF